MRKGHFRPGRQGRRDNGPALGRRRERKRLVAWRDGEGDAPFTDREYRTGGVAHFKTARTLLKRELTSGERHVGDAEVLVGERLKDDGLAVFSQLYAAAVAEKRRNPRTVEVVPGAAAVRAVLGAVVLAGAWRGAIAVGPVAFAPGVEELDPLAAHLRTAQGALPERLGHERVGIVPHGSVPAAPVVMGRRDGGGRDVNRVRAVVHGAGLGACGGGEIVPEPATVDELVERLEMACVIHEAPHVGGETVVARRLVGKTVCDGGGGEEKTRPLVPVARFDDLKLRGGELPQFSRQRRIPGRLRELRRAQEVADRVDRRVEPHELRDGEAAFLRELRIVAEVPFRLRELVEIGLVFGAGAPAAALDGKPGGVVSRRRARELRDGRQDLPRERLRRVILQRLSNRLARVLDVAPVAADLLAPVEDVVAQHAGIAHPGDLLYLHRHGKADHAAVPTADGAFVHGTARVFMVGDHAPRVVGAAFHDEPAVQVHFKQVGVAGLQTRDVAREPSVEGTCVGGEGVRAGKRADDAVLGIGGGVGGERERVAECMFAVRRQLERDDAAAERRVAGGACDSLGISVHRLRDEAPCLGGTAGSREVTSRPHGNAAFER